MEKEKKEFQLPEKVSDIHALIEASLEELIDRLEQEATVYSDAFWAEHQDQREGNSGLGKPLKGSLGVRIQRKDNYLSINWFYATFHGPQGKRKPRHNHISRGNDYRYKRSAFKDCKLWAWEKALFNAVEPKLALIRKKYDYISKMRHALNTLRKQSAKTAIESKAEKLWPELEEAMEQSTQAS